MDDSFGHWLAGFIDGEGTFVIVRMRRESTGRAKYHCFFRLNLRDDDAAIIEEVRTRLGFGHVYRMQRTDGQNQIGWTVHRKHDCLRLVSLLERYPLRAKKRRDFEIWSAAVEEWASSGPGKARDWTKMSELRDDLMEVRKYAA